jgi:hypothetical protein
VDYQAQDALDAEFNTSPLKARNEGSDTDFQANAIASDAGDDSTPTEDTDFNAKEGVFDPAIAAPKAPKPPKPPKQPKQPKIKGDSPSVGPQAKPV